MNILNIFKKKNKSIYQEKLLNAFPESLRKDILEVLKIIPYKSGLPLDSISSDSYEVLIDKEVIKLPLRIYFKEPTDENLNKLSDIQKQILYSIYTRHNNGFIREKYLVKI